MITSSGLNWEEIESEWLPDCDTLELCSELDVDKLTPEIIEATRQEAASRGYLLVNDQYGLSLRRTNDRTRGTESV